MTILKLAKDWATEVFWSIMVIQPNAFKVTPNMFMMHASTAPGRTHMAGHIVRDAEVGAQVETVTTIEGNEIYIKMTTLDDPEPHQKRVHETGACEAMTEPIMVEPTKNGETIEGTAAVRPTKIKEQLEQTIITSAGSDFSPSSPCNCDITTTSQIRVRH